mmetsp:Transcript_34169/g.83736  ORF Transcript_34169/g.83736 Transcript_34169/m.83736 type:complete len:142 (-) Transcript_34169:147-572(-)
MVHPLQALREQCGDQLRDLIDKNTLVDASVDRDGSTMLHFAARDGDLAAVLALLEAGADKDQAMSYGQTPLFMAAQNGHAAVVKALLKAGAEVDKPTNNDCTPLNVAAHHGHTAVVVSLLGAGASKEKANYDDEEDGETPL